MAFLITIADLKTHMNEEVIEEITRDDSEKTQEAIDAAISEAKGYMNKYDLLSLFGSNDVNPAFTDANLKSKVKDLAKWHLVVLGVPDIDYEDAQTRYKYAIEKYFEKIQSGKVAPEGWPFHDTTSDLKPPQGNEISYSSNRKRRQHY